MEQQLIEEMNQIKAFLLSRLNVTGPVGSEAAELAHKLAESMACQISKLPVITPDTASRLMAGVEVSGYDQKGKELIRKAIDAGLLKQSTIHAGSAAKSGKITYQYLHGGQVNYFTATDWQGLESPTKPLQNKIQLVVDRLVSLGINNPDEWTLAWSLGIIVLCHFPVWPKYRSIYNMLLDMKEAISVNRKSWPLPNVVTYPGHPSELADEHLSYTYTEDDPPIDKHIERLRQAALSYIPLRKNNKLLIAEEKAEASAGYKPPMTPGLIAVGDTNMSVLQMHYVMQQQQAELAAMKSNQTSAQLAIEDKKPSPEKPCSPSELAYEKSKLCLTKLRSAKFKNTSSGASSSNAASYPSAGLSNMQHGTLAEVGPATTDTAQLGAAQLDDALMDCQQEAKPIDMDIEQSVVPDMQQTSGKPGVGSAQKPTLSSYEQQLFTAMNSRTKDRAAKARAKTAAQTKMKRPAAANSAAKTIVCPAKGKPPVPTEHGTYIYKQGKIYCRMDVTRFRVIRNRAILNSERVVVWKGDKPSEAEWAKALTYIDEYEA